MAIYFIILGALCIRIMWKDITLRRIENLDLLVLFLLQSIILYLFYQVYFLTPLIVISSGFFLFTMRIIAAGDIKLATVLSLGINIEKLSVALIVMALIGGLQALYYIIKHYYKLKIKSESDVIEKGVPYGVAICVGFYAASLLSMT